MGGLVVVVGANQEADAGRVDHRGAQVVCDPVLCPRSSALSGAVRAEGVAAPRSETRLRRVHRSPPRRAAATWAGSRGGRGGAPLEDRMPPMTARSRRLVSVDVDGLRSHGAITPLMRYTVPCITSTSPATMAASLQGLLR